MAKGSIDYWSDLGITVTTYEKSVYPATSVKERTAVQQKELAISYAPLRPLNHVHIL